MSRCRCTLQKLTTEFRLKPRLGSRVVPPFSVNIEAARLVAVARRTRLHDPRSLVKRESEWVFEKFGRCLR
jgi:hypothetical protein